MNSSDLLTLVSIDPTDPECIQAFEEIHNRYKQFVWNLSYKSASVLDRHNAYKVAMVISQNTFMKIHQNAGKFESQSSDCDRDCKAWISGIIKNISKQYIQENNKHKDHIVFMEIVPDKVDSSNSKKEVFEISYERKILEHALKTLSDKEKDILLAWYNFYTEGKVRSIDKDLKEALAKQYNLKVDSLKKVKERAFNKVLSYIEKNKQK